MPGGGLVIARLGRVNGPRSLPKDIGLGIATPDDVPELVPHRAAGGPHRRDAHPPSNSPRSSSSSPDGSPPTPPRSRHHSWPTSATPPTAWTRSAQTSTEATSHALGVRAGSPRPESPQPEVDSARLLTLGQERRAYPRRSDRLCGQDRCGGIDAAGGCADLGDGRAAGRLPGTMTACPGLVRITRSGCPVPARAASPRPTTTAAGGCIADRPGPPRPSSSCGHGSAPTPSMTSRTCCEPGIPRPGPPPSGSTRPCAGLACKSSTAPAGARSAARASSSSALAIPTAACQAQLHERSRFVRHHNEWTYVDGT